MNISAKQSKAARILLDWHQADLAERSEVSLPTVTAFESGKIVKANTLAKITCCFEAAGIKFTEGDGVRRETHKQTFKGPKGFQAFLDDVYETSKLGSSESRLLGCDPKYWLLFMGEKKWQEHVERMVQIKHLLNVRVLLEEGNTNFLASKFVEYRWIPKNFFNDQALYAYGDKFAMFKFEENDVEIDLYYDKRFADNFRLLFDVFWDREAIEIA